MFNSVQFRQKPQFSAQKTPFSPLRATSNSQLTTSNSLKKLAGCSIPFNLFKNPHFHLNNATFDSCAHR
jgi:hypothetical protein